MGRIIVLAIRHDLFDVHRRRKLVDREMMRINDAHAIPGHEPYSSIRRLGHIRTVAPIDSHGPDSVRCVEYRGFDQVPWVICPGIPLRTVNPGEAAGHVHPHGMIVVFDGPMDLVAGKAVLAAECFDVTVLDAAQSALGRCPYCAARAESQMIDSAAAQPIGGGVRNTDLPILEMGDSSFPKPEPDAAP